VVNGRKSRAARAAGTPKRHHVVARTYLGAWANTKSQVLVFDTRGHSFVTNISNVAVRNDFYTIGLPDGTDSVVVEKAMASIEGATADSLRRVASGTWPLDAEDRSMLAVLLALQLTRGPGLRASFNEFLDKVVQKAESMSASMMTLRSNDLAAYEKMVRFGEQVRADDRGTSIDEVQAARDRTPLTMLRSSEGLPKIVAAMSWTLLETRTLEFVTSDQPVVIWPKEGAVAFFGTGLLTASRVTYPVAPNFCLSLTWPTDDLRPTAGREACSDREVEQINHMTTKHADKHTITRLGSPGANSRSETNPG
jgi:Protein of unknown function (DUF4238)